MVAEKGKATAGTPGAARAEEILLVGLDMGCFKTSVAATNGVREHVHSVVGWPRDPIAKKLLGKDVVLGNEAYKHRLALDMVRPFEKGALKYTDSTTGGVPTEKLGRYKNAARELVRHAVELCRPPRGTLVYGVIGAPATASITNKEQLVELCKGVLDACMIVSEPFAVAYGLNMLEDTLVVDIGAGTTDLCRMHGTMPSAEDQITLAIAGDYVDEQAAELIRSAHPTAQFTVNMVREAKERFSFVHEVNDKAIVTWPDTKGHPTAYDITQPLQEACRQLIPPIVQGLRKLVSTFDAEFQKRLLGNVVLAGGGSQIRGLNRLIEKDLAQYGGGQVIQVQEPVYAGANGALKLASDMPDDYWSQLK
jgi:rod shape-determining protein MreB